MKRHYAQYEEEKRLEDKDTNYFQINAELLKTRKLRNLKKSLTLVGTAHYRSMVEYSKTKCFLPTLEKTSMLHNILEKNRKWTF